MEPEPKIEQPVENSNITSTDTSVDPLVVETEVKKRQMWQKGDNTPSVDSGMGLSQKGTGPKIDPIWQKKDILGMDIGTGFLKVVQLKKKGLLTKLVGYGKMAIPENYIIEGIIAEPEKLAELTKNFFAKDVWGSITAKRVCTSLPESKIFTRTITLPHMNGKDLEQAVNWEASQTIPMSMSDLYLDYRVIGPSLDDPKNDEIIYAAAPKAIVDSYIQFFDILGFEVESIETSLTAIIRAAVSKKNSKEVVLVVDIGGKTTSLAVFDGVVRLTGSTLVGGEHITSRIAEGLNIDEKEAEKIKKQKSTDILKLRQAFDIEVTMITKEAGKMISYYQKNKVKANPVTRAILCGGSASLTVLADVFKEKLGIDIDIGNPWTNISIYPLKSVPKDEAPTYTNAVGLALLGVNDD
jgi:type IV pilus assembly protein PilM